MSARLAALILAGGKGERLGGAVKANVRVGGVRLLERVSAALGRQPDLVLVSTGAFPAGEVGPLAGQVAVPDLVSGYGGPLAGVAAAVDWCSRVDLPPELLLTAAVDTPFLPEDFTETMLGALPPDCPAVVARHAGQAYPTNALWRLSAIADLPARLAGGTAPHSLRRLAEEVGASFRDWPATAFGDPFANVNTPDDLRALEARARRGN